MGTHGFPAERSRDNPKTLAFNLESDFIFGNSVKRTGGKLFTDVTRIASTMSQFVQ